MGNDGRQYQDFDESGAVSRVEGDRALLIELFDLFFSDADMRLVELAATIDRADARGVQERAHALKSALGNLGAECASQLAAALERAGREGNLSDAPRLCSELKSSVARFRAATDAWRRS